MEASEKDIFKRFNGQQTQINDHQQRLLDFIKRFELYKAECSASEKQGSETMRAQVESVQANILHIANHMESLATKEELRKMNSELVKKVTEVYVVPTAGNSVVCNTG